MATAGSATAVAESPRVSMTVKTGLNFVIPKNKLSGAMVSFHRSSTKSEPLEPKKEEPKLAARKTKWGPDLTQDPAVKRGRALALQTRAEQLAAQLESGNLDIDNNEETRSPSPPPLYDILGHKMNTREGRKRELLDLERREAIGECMKLNPAYKSPSGFKPVTKEAKLYIPAKEHPGYNFIGLILGPQGNTQKRMESETGAKITIRGKGAVKEGKMQTARNGKDMDGALDELHVHISADSFEKVDAAVALIEPLLTPVDEDRNMHKMKQLRELAEMNGTLNDFTKACSVCGEAGHMEWQCSQEKLQTLQANVLCQICGDGSHPMTDCPLKSSGQGMMFNKEYFNFLEEVGTGLQGVGKSANDDHPSDSNTSQPMLLTTLGAHPVPMRWMAPAGAEIPGSFAASGPPDGANFGGMAPRFPNSPGFQGIFPNPPGSQGIFPNHPGFQGVFPNPPGFSQSGAVPSGPPRGQPFHGSVFPMTARMHSASPAGLVSDMRPPGPPVLPPAAGMPWLPPTSISTIGQTQASGSANEGTIRGPQSINSIQVENERKYGLNAVSAVSSVAASPTAYPDGLFSQGAALVQPVLPLSTSNPAGSRPMLPLAPVQMVGPPPVVHTVRPVLPSMRPVPPSARPMVSVTAQAPSLAGRPGQGPANVIPPFGVTTNDSLPSGNSSFPRPPQPIPGGLTVHRYPGPFPSAQQLASTLDKPPSTSFAPPPHPFPPPFSTTIRLSSPPPVSDPMQGQTITRPPTMSSSFTPIASRTPQSQFMITPNNHQMVALPFNPRPTFPPLLGTQIRPINPPNTVPVMGGNSLLASQQNLPIQPPELLRPSIQLSQQGNAFPRVEFAHVRHPHSVPGGPQIRTEFQPGTLASPSSILGSAGFNRPPAQMPPQEALNRAYSSNFPRPPPSPLPILTGNTGASWDPSLPHNRNRPDMLQLQGQSGMFVNKSWNADPHLRSQLPNVPVQQAAEVDPEYEKLMASVGVL